MKILWNDDASKTAALLKRVGEGRTFWAYGITFGWWFIGIMRVKQDEMPNSSEGK